MNLPKDGRVAINQGISCFFRPKYLISLLLNHGDMTCIFDSS